MQWVLVSFQKHTILVAQNTTLVTPSLVCKLFSISFKNPININKITVYFNIVYIVLVSHSMHIHVHTLMYAITPPIPHTIGAVVGFNMTTYTADESETVEVCVSILSPNETVLMASAVHGEFNITISGGQATGDYLCLIRLLHS